MSRGIVLFVMVIVLWTITAPVTAVGAPGVSDQLPGSATTVDESGHLAESSAQMQGNDTVFEQVSTNSSSLIMKVNTSLFTTLFRPGSVFRIVAGGTANGQRVVWFDIGIGRGPGGFEVRSEMSINMPSM